MGFRSVVEMLEYRYGGGEGFEDLRFANAPTSKDSKKRKQSTHFYDYNDPFIDDSDLNHGFERDKHMSLKQTKHSGFFVNKGELSVLNDNSFDSSSNDDDDNHTYMSLEGGDKSTNDVCGSNSLKRKRLSKSERDTVRRDDYMTDMLSKVKIWESSMTPEVTKAINTLKNEAAKCM